MKHRDHKSAGQGELEAAVMEICWSHDGWLSPRHVMERLAVARGDLAYTTVMTVMARLWKKEMLERQPEGRGYSYRPVHTREEWTAARMSELLELTTNRSGTLTHFVASITPAQRAALQKALQGRRRR